MKNKNYFSFAIILFFFCSTIHSQQNKLNSADKKYDNLSYVDAISVYEKIANKGYKSVDLFQKLGNSYYFNADYVNANKWYTELFNLNEQIDPEYYYRYSQTLKSVGDNVKSNENLEKFSQLVSSDKRAMLYTSNRDYLNEIKKNSGRYDINNSAINSSSSDYGAIQLDDKILFTSNRVEKGMNKRINKWDKQPFSNLYSATIVPEGGFSSPELISSKINSKFHESSPVFTKDGKTMFFTRNNFINGKKGKDSKEIILLKIFKATLVNNEWTNVTELPFNSNDFSCAHPTLASDDKFLYFSSNMPGGFGSSDLYKVAILENDKFGTPTNLGNKINTEGRETFSFIDENNELYFSSDGHLGLGGLDVFVTKIHNDDTFSKVKNVGEPINGESDDFAFTIKSKKGYFTSNRKGGKGSDDIYDLIEKIKLNVNDKKDLIVSTADQDEKLPIEGVKITIMDDKMNIIKEVITNGQANTTFNDLNSDATYFVKLEKDGYDTVEKMIKFQDDGNDSETIAFNLSKKVKQINVGSNLADTFGINYIYFDLDKHFIRNDAEVDLAKILEVLLIYPSMKIEIVSHTDSRNSDKYNLKLSNKRAKATFEWLVKKGIDSNRLSYKGMGESMLINHCKDGVKCSETEHDQNRRSEFIIIQM